MISENAEHTFVVCAYGESRYLEECLASLALQTRPSHVLVATATPNALIESAARAYGVPLLVHETPPSIASDWNFAYSAAQTRYVTLAHQDDIYLPDYGERIVEALERAINPLIAFCDYAEIRRGETVVVSSLRDVKRLLLRPLRDPARWSKRWAKRFVIAFGNGICCPSVTYNRERLGPEPFGSTFQSNLDWELWERLSREEGSFVYVDEVLMLHRVHEGSETAKLIEAHVRQSEDRAILERFWPHPIARVLGALYASSIGGNRISE